MRRACARKNKDPDFRTGLTRTDEPPTLARAVTMRVTTRLTFGWRAAAVSICGALIAVAAAARVPADARPSIERFPLRSTGLHLQRPTYPGAFFDVVGRRSAFFGYESREIEAWVYPLKLLSDFSLS